MENQITFQVTLNLDRHWASHVSKEQLIEYMRDRLNSSVGFRGQVERFNVVDDGLKSENMKMLTGSQT
jgi:hypothetical protein